MNRPRSRRRIGRDVARAGAGISAVMLGLSAISALDPGPPAAAQAAAGELVVVVPPEEPNEGKPLNSGGSATYFTLRYPTAAACTGDSANGGYRIQSYMVPAAVDPGTLTFNNEGPVPYGEGAELRVPLFSHGVPFVNRNTALETPGIGGLLVDVPPFSFDVLADIGADSVPEGVYNIGLACTRASGTVLDKYWNVQMEIIHDPTDEPAGLRWEVVTAAGGTTTTSTSSTTTDPSSTTTTTTRGSSTTTTTTASSATTTTTTNASSSTTTTTTFASSSGSGSGTGVSSSGGSPSGTSFTGALAATGASTQTIVIWAILLVVFGRMALLLGRVPKVKPPK